MKCIIYSDSSSIQTDYYLGVERIDESTIVDIPNVVPVLIDNKKQNFSKGRGLPSNE